MAAALKAEKLFAEVSLALILQVSLSALIRIELPTHAMTIPA